MTAPDPHRSAHGLGRLRVLLVDDEADLRLGLRLLLEPLGAEVREAESGERAIEVLAGWVPHVVISDLTMRAVSGMELLGHVRERHPAIRVLMLTGYGTIALAVEAMQKGAANFLVKPFDRQEVLAEVEKHGSEALVAERVRRMKPAGGDGGALILAEDRRMIELLELVRQVAPTGMPVLIHGESGTGKELVARALHAQSRDPSLPFLPVNSAALPDTLLESELFGYRKGAFTGADENREGIFARARGGTVFLDEIALMSPAFQGKLLRVLQEHTVTPLGTSTPKPVAFRLVAATNRSLRDRIAEGAFREDLYYRLRVATITVPPLRERADDIVPLAAHFLARYAREAGYPAGHPPSLTAGALEALRLHRWPGNVRELENSIQRALIVGRGGDITARHLGLDESSTPWSGPDLAPLSYEAGKNQAIAAYQRRVVERALRASRGNVTQAAERCDLTRAAFQRLMRQLEVDRQRFRGETK